MPESCNITFSPYLALIDLPAHDVIAAHRYHVSDQTFISDTGATVRFIARPFIATENRSFSNPDLPDLVAGHCYLTFKTCLIPTDNIGDCEVGACVRSDVCCDLTTEEECDVFDDGVWLGLGTPCLLPPCDFVVCCVDEGGDGCLVTTPNLCVNFPNQGEQAGEPFHDAVSCDGCIGGCCIGACCIHIGNEGTFCFPRVTPVQCHSPVEHNLIIDPGVPFWPMWMGRHTCCDTEETCMFATEQGEYIDCPTTFPCCPSTGQNDGDCEDLEPHVCLEQDGTVGTPGLACINEPGICDGACCVQFVDAKGGITGGVCIDTDFDGCVEAGLGNQFTFLGPGTNCEDDGGGCGACCIYDSASDSFTCVEGLTQSECFDNCGRPKGPGTTCDTAICDFETRACCVAFPAVPGVVPNPGDPGFGEFEHPLCRGPFHCVPVTSRVNCESMLVGGQRSRFYPCQTCHENPCQAVGGACCVCRGPVCQIPAFPPGLECPETQPGDNGCICFDSTREICAICEGSFWGEGTGCCSNPGGGGPLPVCCVECPEFGGPALNCGADAPPPSNEDPCVPMGCP